MTSDGCDGTSDGSDVLFDVMSDGTDVTSNGSYNVISDVRSDGPM